LTTMHAKNMYKHMVFYLESCESGRPAVTYPMETDIDGTAPTPLPLYLLALTLSPSP